MIGAATTWLLVNMAATFAPPSHTASATSGLPEALSPAVTADQRKPSGRGCAVEVLLTNRLYRRIPVKCFKIMPAQAAPEEPRACGVYSFDNSGVVGAPSGVQANEHKWKWSRERQRSRSRQPGLRRPQAARRVD